MSVKSLRAREGYLVIDNRFTPGVDDATMVAMGYAPGAGRGLYESATYTCNHCNTPVVIEPKRTRARGYCRKCAHQICDGCTTLLAATMECVPMAKKIDEYLESAVRQSGSSLILP